VLEQFQQNAQMESTVLEKIKLATVPEDTSAP